MDPHVTPESQIITLGHRALGMSIQAGPEFSKINTQETPKLKGAFIRL